MKGAYTTNNAYSSAYVLNVLMKGVYTTNSVYSNAYVLKVLTPIRCLLDLLIVLLTMLT